MISREIRESPPPGAALPHALYGSFSRRIARQWTMVHEGAAPGTLRVNPRIAWVAVASGVVACLWFLFLSWRVLALPSTVIATAVDHIFDGDPATRTRIIIGLREQRPPRDAVPSEVAPDDVAPNAPEPSAFRIPRHPFAGRVWPLIGRPAHWLMSRFFEEPRAQIHAARLVCAVVGGFGVACLVLLIGIRGVDLRLVLLAAAVYLGFTSHVITAIPELIGLSGALLSATLLVHHLPLRRSLKVAAYAVLAVALGGTTIVLALFPLLCMLWMHPAVATFSPIDFGRRHRVAVGILAVVLVAFAVLGFQQAQSLFWRAGGWERVGLAREDVRWMTTERFTDPAAAFAHVVLSLVYPAVGPDAATVSRSPSRGDPYVALSYEPWRLDAYGWLNGLGAAAWLLLLILTISRAWRDPSERPTIRLLGVWIAFNVAMHLFWGREVFLYTPHWAWAVFALTAGGLKGMRVATVGALAAVILLGQLTAFASIFRAVQIVVASS